MTNHFYQEEREAGALRLSACNSLPQGGTALNADDTAAVIRALQLPALRVRAWLGNNQNTAPFPWR